MKKGLTTLLIAGTLLSSCDLKREKVIVETGEIKESKNPMVSHNFQDCSAIIFDYGRKALFAHSVPRESYNLRGFPVAGTYDVIDDMVEILHSKKIKLEKVKAYVHAGSVSSLKKIEKDLEKYGIKAKEITVKDIYWINKIRDVSYDPLRNKMTVTGVPYGTYNERLNEMRVK
jgi:hypothetical protein